MNILVTGAGGQLGTSLREAALGSADRYVFSDVNVRPGEDTLLLDATNEAAVQIVCDSENIDVIVNCAGYTNVDKAEDDQALARLLNVSAPAALAAVCKRRGAALIHISTDYVFGGNACIPYREDATPDPQGVYAVTKLQGENAVRESGCKYLILRTSWLYSPFGRNFVRTILGAAANRPALTVVYDQVGSPTYAPCLASFIRDVISSHDFSRFGRDGEASGIYNFSGEGAVSWYDFACAIVALGRSAGLLAKDCKVSPCLSSQYPVKAARPHYSVLDKQLIKTSFGIEIPHWRDSLEQCIKRLAK